VIVLYLHEELPQAGDRRTGMYGGGVGLAIIIARASPKKILPAWWR